MNAASQDFGKQCVAKAGGGGRLVAAGTGDNTEITGQTIDCKGYGSCKIGVAYHCVVADTKTLSIGTKYQTSSDGSSWDTAVVLEAPAVKATGANPTLEFNGVVSFDLALSPLKRYLRVNVTPDLNASGTDTAEVATVVILGGADSLPAA